MSSSADTASGVAQTEAAATGPGAAVNVQPPVCPSNPKSLCRAHFLTPHRL